MYKVLILILLVSASVAVAEQLDEQCLGVHKLRKNQLTFFYNRQDKVEETYFYVKALTDSEASEQNSDNILTMGEKLAVVQNTTPAYYLVPENAQKLYILQSKTRLEGAVSSARVIPEMVNNYIKSGRKRNVDNYPQPLPPEEHVQALELGNASILLGSKTAEKVKMKICKLVL